MPPKRNWYPVVVLALLLGFLLAVSWKRWINPIVDCGREMYLPWQICEGRMLYRDLFFLYGPLIPYWHALLFQGFGAHLNVLYAVGIGLVAAQTALVYAVARRLLAVPLATLAGALFLVQFAVRPSLNNLVFPYSFNASYAGLLNLLALWLVLRAWPRAGRSLEWTAAGLCIGLSLLSKQELGLGAGLALVVALGMAARDSRLPLRGALLAVTPAVVLPLVGYGWFALQIGPSRFFHEHLVPLRALRGMHFFERYSVGTLWEPGALLYLLLLALGTAGALGAVLAGAYLLGRRSRPAMIYVGVLAVGLVLLWLPVSERFFLFLEYNQMYACSFFVLLMALAEGFRRWRESDPAGAPLFLVACFALCCSWRAPLFAGVSTYSAFFMSASVVVFLWFWAEWIAGRCQLAQPGLWQRSVMVVFGAICVLTACRGITLFRTQFTWPIQTPRGDLIVHREVGPVLADLAAFVRTNTAPREPLLFFPEEASLYFLCDRRSPSRYYQFAPYLPSETQEREITVAADAAGVRWVTVSNRSTSEYGVPYFGIHYYAHLRQWILANFRLVQTLGNPVRPDPPPPPSRYWPREGYGIEIYERVPRPDVIERTLVNP